MALRPITSANAILPYIEELDMVLVMTVEPGFGGQSFMESQLETIRQVRAIIEKYHPTCELEVDGGIAPKTAPLVVEAGANVLGSRLRRLRQGGYPRRHRRPAGMRGALL